MSGVFTFGADPILNHLSPAAGQRGTTVAVTVAGKFDPWPVQAWVDSPGITFKPTKTAGKFDVEIARDAAPGPHLVRLFNESGASAPRFFIVAREPQTAEVEPNDDFHKPQKIATLPATINGKLDKAGDVDSFAVTLKRGQTLVAWTEAYVLASTFDGMLRVVDVDGHELAFNHDGRTLDPFLTWTAPRDGTFVVQTMGFVYPGSSAIGFTGGEGCVYRLHLTAGPFVQHTLPMAVARGKKTPVELVGWNLTDARAEIDGATFPAGSATADIYLPGITSHLPLTISDIPEVVEKEPNDTAANAQTVEIPTGVSGCINRAGDEDRFAFTAVKGRAYEVKVTAASLGSALDAWLKIEDKAGKQLATNDDVNGFRDSALTWTAPSDGTFICALGDVTHHGGGDYFYRLTITEAAPSVSATVTVHSASLVAGKDAELKVAVKRAKGFKSKLQFVAKSLPDGVTAAPADVPEKDGDVTLKFAATADAKPAGTAFTLVLRETEGGIEHPAHFSLVASTENTGVPQGYTELVINATDQLWLTVLPATAKPEPPKPEAKK